jgi:hypothetical protein
MLISVMLFFIKMLCIFGFMIILISSLVFIVHKLSFREVLVFRLETFILIFKMLVSSS